MFRAAELAKKLEQIESMEEIATYARILDQRVDLMVAEGKAEGRRESLLDLAGQFLDATQLEVSGRWLSACTVDQLPSTSELYRIAHSSPDAAEAILERFRRCRDNAS